MAFSYCRQRRLIYSLLIFSISVSTDAAEPLEFPLSPYVDAIYVPVELGGEERLFLLDSGFSLIMVDESLKEHLGEFVGEHFSGIPQGRK